MNTTRLYLNQYSDKKYLYLENVCIEPVSFNFLSNIFYLMGKDMFHIWLTYNLSIFLLSWKRYWASLVAQWLRVCLPMQGTRVRALVWEDPTCRGAAGLVSRNYWAWASVASAPQQERPRQWKARAPPWRVAPACRNWRKPSHEPKTQHSQK